MRSLSDPIRRPLIRDETIRVTTLLAFSLGGLALGALMGTLIVLATSTPTVAPAAAARRAPDHAPVIRATKQPPPAPRQNAAPAPTVVPTPTASVQTQVAMPPPSPMANPKPARTRQVLPGLLAYLRCEGLENPAARQPCPRDRAFERDVWRMLDNLKTCTVHGLDSGAAELRLTLQPDHSPVAEVRAANDVAGSLNPRQVGRCLGEQPSQLRTTLNASELLVSFRFVITTR